MAGIDDLNPELARRLQALRSAAQDAGISIGWGSGTRSIQEQIELRKTNGCPDVWTSPARTCRIPTAIPGRSNHNHGLAMDLAGPDGRALRRDRHPKEFAWVQANLAGFGLHLAVEGEDWHVEMTGDEAARQGMVGTSPDAIGFDMQWMDEPANPEDELSRRLDSVMQVIGSGIGPIETPEDMENPLGTDLTTIPSGETFRRELANVEGGGAVGEGDQIGNARIIAQVGRQLGAPDDAIKIALAAALVESNLRNVNYGDRDSLGLFQQRPSQGWGTPEQVRNPAYAAQQFFNRLLALDWQNMNPGAAAQAVQRSAFPDRYGQRMGEAAGIFNQIRGF